VGADKKEKPLQEIKIVKVEVFSTPIPEADDLLEQFIRKNIQNRISESKLKAVPSASGNGPSTSVESNDFKIRKLA
jgi:hypothetical protein